MANCECHNQRVSLQNEFARFRYSETHGLAGQAFEEMHSQLARSVNQRYCRHWVPKHRGSMGIDGILDGDS